MGAGPPRLRILVVENEGLLRLAAEEMLLELGHEVVGWANRARTAIAEADRTRPDLVLMDIQLDGPRDGVDAAHEIKERFGIASLFVTGTMDEATYQRALATQPLGYLRKPLQLPDLQSALAPLGHGRTAREHSPQATSATPVSNVQFLSFGGAPKTPPDTSE
jgi:CheY-like chemotaxis protein